MLTDTVSDRAVGLSTLSHTKTVASYEPELDGIHDGDKPVKMDNG